MKQFQQNMDEIMALGQEGKWEDARRLCAKAETLFKDYLVQNPEARAELYWQEVRNISHSGELHTALVMALSVHRAHPGTTGAIKSLAWASMLQTRLEDYQKAICYSNEVLPESLHDGLIANLDKLIMGMGGFGAQMLKAHSRKSIDDVDPYTAGLVRANVVTAHALQEDIDATRGAADEARRYGEEHHQRECIYWANMLQAYAERSRTLYDEALKFEDALKPAGMLHAHLRKAQVLKRLGEENDFAEKAIEEATRIGNDYVLGQAYETIGDMEHAIEAYERARLLAIPCPLSERINEARK